MTSLPAGKPAGASHITKEPSMAKCALADALDTGAAADIFYDARDHQDSGAVTTIENFQDAVDTAARELRLIAGLDLSGDTILLDDLATLRAIQARIQKD
jgi:hypothetical protein